MAQQRRARSPSRLPGAGGDPDQGDDPGCADRQGACTLELDTAASERFIYFFDTPALDLSNAGIVARPVPSVGKEHDSTVKARPVVPEKVSTDWSLPGSRWKGRQRERRGRIEQSLSMPSRKEGLIKAVLAGEKKIVKLFAREQEAFVAELVKGKMDYSTVAILGPLHAQRWKLEDRGCPWPITAELWRREDGNA